jgi:hypothetical protein
MRILKRTKRFLTARSTVLVLLILLTAAMTAAVVIDQTSRFRIDGDMADGGASPSRLAEILGLSHVFSTWWFAALGVGFVASLFLSTFDQLAAARARMRHLPPGVEGGARCTVAREEVEKVLAREGYRRVAEGPGSARYVKFWPGYWGNFLLHFGMTISVLFALVYVMTEHRVILRAVSGEGAPVVAGAHPERRGLLAWPLRLPARLKLVRLEPSFYDNDRLKDLASHLALVDERGAAEDVRVAVNDQRRHAGMLLYQLQKFGSAFQVRFRDFDGEEFDLLMPLPSPPKREEAGYGTFRLEPGRLTVKAKYHPSADRSTMLATNPQLVLRLQDGELAVAEATLLPGQQARLGRYEVRLTSVETWTDILFEGSQGTVGIFFGFAVLLLGGVLTFFGAPRETLLQFAGTGVVLAWRTTRFPDLYGEERDRILALCTGGPES